MKRLNQGRVAEVLLVEDNEGDAILTREAFASANFMVNMHHVVNGEECLKFLRKESPYEDSPDPDLILLDLNMPVMSGHEVLKEMSADPALRKYRVVVLTTSEADSDVLGAYESPSCTSYVTKPVDFEKFLQVVSDISGYWLTLVILPTDAGDTRSPAAADAAASATGRYGRPSSPVH